MAVDGVIMSGKDSRLITDEDYEKWFKEWTDMMTTIWRDRMRKLHVSPYNPDRALETWRPDPGSLHASLVKGQYKKGASKSAVKITHSLLTYGIFVDLGTGREFGGPRNEKGQLLKQTARKPKPWFSKAYYRSVMVAKEFAAKAYGDEFKGILFQSAREIAKALRKAGL